MVRKRPLNRKEIDAQHQDVVACTSDTVFLSEPKLKVDLTRFVEQHRFVFDYAFDESVTNEQLYQTSVRPLIDSVFEDRAKCTCFAYGQTGSGKTHTMMGPPRRDGEMGQELGIFALSARDIFQRMRTTHTGMEVHISFYEIYCGKLYDLLNDRRLLHARENAKSNVVIVGLREHVVSSVDELLDVIEVGLTSRTTGVTGANVDSSRSHAIIQVALRSATAGGARLMEHGKISFIDLAGSERGADVSDQDRQTRIDGAEINKSLLALKECIRAMDQQHEHTPFRGSKLTQVLKDSFVGERCNTVMIANVSPCAGQVEHSLNTLRYAYRVKELRSGKGTGGAPPELIRSCATPARAPHSDADYSARFVPSEELLVAEESSNSDIDPGTPRTYQACAHPQAMRSQSSRAAESAWRKHGSDAGASMPDVESASSLTALRRAAATASSTDARAAWASPRAHEQGRASPTNSQAIVPATSGELGASEETAVEAELVTNAVVATPEVAPQLAGDPQAALDELARTHNRLIGTILSEEEELITAHRQHIDSMVELIKEEMMELNGVDRPGSDVDTYVTALDRILTAKENNIKEIRNRLAKFQGHLEQESSLSRTFQSLIAGT